MLLATLLSHLNRGETRQSMSHQFSEIHDHSMTQVLIYSSLVFLQKWHDSTLNHVHCLNVAEPTSITSCHHFSHCAGIWAQLIPNRLLWLALISLFLALPCYWETPLDSAPWQRMSAKLLLSIQETERHLMFFKCPFGKVLMVGMVDGKRRIRDSWWHQTPQFLRK